MSRRAHLPALLGYLALSLLVTWPLALHFGTATLGPHIADRMQNEWNLWWVRQALLAEHTNPYHTTWLFYPQGVDLYFHTLDLPLNLAVLPIAALFGLTAGYNSSAILAVVLAAYAGFRLAGLYVADPRAAFAGGLVIGFNPFSFVMMQSQTNIANLGPCVLCMEFYLRSWRSGRRRDMVLTGLFFALAVLTVGYYEGYLLLFFTLHLLWLAWSLWRARRESKTRFTFHVSRFTQLLRWAGGPALLLAGPYALAAWRSAAGGQVAPFTDVDAEQPLHNAADLLSFLLPNRDSALFQAAPWWPAINPNVHTFFWLGPVTVALAALGLRIVDCGLRNGDGKIAASDRRAAESNSPMQHATRNTPIPRSAIRNPQLAFWLAFALIGAGLALGPLVQWNAEPVAGGVWPGPFSLLRLIPPFNLMRVPYRFTTLLWIGLGVPAAGGTARLLAGIAGRNTQHATRNTHAAAALILALLIAQLPLRDQPLRADGLPPSLQAVAADPAPGALVELPFTQHGGLDAARMLYQTGHGRPIAGGYLARTVANPYPEACSPFQALALYPDLPARDIITPTGQSLLPAILADQRVAFLAVYKSRTSDPANADPLPAVQLTALQTLAARLGTPLADDETATTYRVAPAPGPLPRFWQLGFGWHDPETRAGAPFRWMADSEADGCVFNPAPATGRLTLRVASFAVDRTLTLWAGDRLLLTTTVPADGQLHPLVTPAVPWPAGPQPILLRAAAPGTRPADLAPSRDARVLRVGVSDLAWEP